MFKQRSWIGRWHRRDRGISEAAEFERLTQERLYGERRAVDRLVERRPSECPGQEGQDEPVGSA